MSKIAIIIASILGFALIMGLWLMGNYNSLVTANNAVNKSWSKVETQYQQRLDLIDNLVQIVKSGQTQEIAVFSKIAEARSRVNSSYTTDGKVGAMNDMETNIALIPRLQEAYPDLKSFQQVQALFDQMAKTEAGVATARDNYNDTATNFNNNVMSFPKNMFAKAFDFTPRTLFKSETGAEKGVKIKF